MLRSQAKRARAVAVVVTATAALVGQSPERGAQLEFFEQRIRPVLASSCYECHSTHGEQLGDVVLDHREGIRAEATEGRVVTPGNPDQSVLLMVMRHEIDGLEMPEDGAKLSDEVIADFERWIRDGAFDPRDQPPTADELAGQTAWPAKLAQRRAWWSLQPVRHHEPPPSDEWSTHPVDRFVAAAQRERDLSRAPRASRRVLLRRLHYALTGLPPSPEQLAAFERDDEPGAFERAVDALLALPAYGEHWARHWMDVVRYADSHGSEGDPSVPYSYRYRDYLIRAFNQDVPYDQLVREHVAGDLLEEQRIDDEGGIVESAIGTAHYRFVFHGYLPTEPLEEKVRFVDDQINVLGKAFLGQTISCARCHDHKFDAISQADYYALFGVLSSCRPGILDVNTAARQSAQVQPIRALKRELRSLVAATWRDHVTGELTTRLEDVDRDIEADHPAWLLREIDRTTGRRPSERTNSVAFAAAMRAVLDSSGFRDATNGPATGTLRIGPNDPEGYYFYGNGLSQGATPAGAFAVGREGEQALQGIYPAGTYTHLDTPRHRGVLHSRRFHVGPAQVAWALVFGRAAHLRFVVQDYPRSGLTFQRVNLDHDEWRWRRVDLGYWSDERAHVEMTTSKDAPVEAGGGEEGFFGLRDVRIQAADAPAPGFEPDPYGIAAAVREAEPQPHDRRGLVAIVARRIRAAAERWAADACDDRDALLLDACIRYGVLPNELGEIDGARALVEEIRERSEQVPTPTRVAGLIEADATDHPLFERGDPSRPAAMVPRRFLEVLGGARYDGAQSGRRALAEDIASATNPLTARVMVNRVWHHLFGRGIVATPDNFGQLGAEPTHPELLDHLAARFVEEGWSIKRLVRYLVTSESWQLDSTPPTGAAEDDPEGIWLTHAPVRRLTAESLRDSLFAVAGALEERRYGPPFGANTNTARRSVYVRTKRNNLDQLLAAFDAPTPFAPVGARLVTNVPAQSLTLLNDPLIWELAERWAASTSGLGDRGERAASMFEAATGRAPTQAERERLVAYVDAAAAAERSRTAEVAAVDAAVAQVEERIEALISPARASLLQSSDAATGPAPIASWDFRGGLQDQVGALHGTLRGTARLDESGLVLDGGGWMATSPLRRSLNAKTLEAWVKLDDLDQRGGGVLTVQDLRGDVFDGIVYAERQRARWIAGSDHFRRTEDVDGGDEHAAGDQPVHVAVAYEADGTVTIFRNGRPYGRSYRTDVARFERDDAQVLVGLRHGSSAGGRALRGKVLAARLYDRALSAGEVLASASGEPFVSRERAMAALSDAARGEVRRLDAQLDELRGRRARHDEEHTARGAWTLLAHAIFNLKEFRFLR